MAPPITVDIMVVLLGRFGFTRGCARRTGSLAKYLAKHAPTRRHFTAQTEASRYA
jgi:hypothetical protein